MHIKNLNISKKIYLLATLLIITFSICTIWLYSHYRDNPYEIREWELSMAIETDWGMVEHFAALEKSGELSRD